MTMKAEIELEHPDMLETCERIRQAVNGIWNVGLFRGIKLEDRIQLQNHMYCLEQLLAKVDMEAK